MSEQHYKTREVRDLAWACFSPPLFHSEKLAAIGQLVSNCGLGLTAERAHWLADIDKHPAALLRHLSTLHNSRLGLYFESLWHFFLQHDPQIELIAHNLPIREGGRTLGEFDCLYYCKQRQRHIHLELAVKYYLSHRQSTVGNSPSSWTEWLGPGNTDNLDRKIRHLMQHQIQLGDQPAAQQALEQLGISKLAKEVEIKGYLFQSCSDPLPAPHAHNPQSRLSQWFTVNELAAHANTLGLGQYRVLPKPEWLAPAREPPQSEEAVSYSHLLNALTDHFNANGRAQLVASLDKQGDELERFFVTDVTWPPE